MTAVSNYCQHNGVTVTACISTQFSSLRRPVCCICFSGRFMSVVLRDAVMVGRVVNVNIKRLNVGFICYLMIIR